MKFPRNAKIFRGQLDAAPFAGVLFLLLIFLVFSSSLISIPGVKIQLPESSALPGVTGRTVVVAVDLSGQLYYEGQTITEEKLRASLQAAVRSSDQPLTLVVQADKSVNWATAVVRMGQLARAAGIHDVLWATRPRVFPGPANATGLP